MAWGETTREQYRRPMDRYETDLTGEEWELIGSLIPPPPKMGRPREPDMREAINATQLMLGPGCLRWAT